jgi:hypothetical protein
LKKIHSFFLAAAKDRQKSPHTGLKKPTQARFCPQKYTFLTNPLAFPPLPWYTEGAKANVLSFGQKKGAFPYEKTHLSDLIPSARPSPFGGL